MYEEYSRYSKAKPRQFNLGNILLWKKQGKPWVFNLGTQQLPGAHATCAGIEMTLESMKGLADSEGIKTLAIPQIGAGY